MSRRARKPPQKSAGIETYSLDFVARPSTTRTGIAISQTLSLDRKRVYQSGTPTTLPSPKKRKTNDELHTSDDANQSPLFSDMPWESADWNDLMEGPDFEEAPTKKTARRKWNLASDEPLREFRLHHADEFAEELIRADGRGDAAGRACPLCRSTEKGDPLYRCKSCFGCDLLCQSCFLTDHARRPFCRVEKWNSTSFERTSLQSLGLCIQLGHAGGEQCPTPDVVQNFTIVHTNGIHTCTVRFCNCKDAMKAGTRCQQLMRRGLLPATMRDPQTACTFEVLRQFQALSLQGKVSLYDYYSGLEKLTDATGTSNLKDRLKSFMRCVRIWKYLQILRRGGRMNVPGKRPTQFKEGDLAVECPACPRPGINIPDNWKSLPEEQRFIYTLFVALDACFRLKRRRVSTKERDPPLIDGGAYMVQSGPFEAYLEGVKDQKEINTCNGLSAVDHANTKYSKGYAETGKVLGICARHEFVQKTGVVPTQVGERYANTDYALGSLMRFHSGDLPLVLSYDISCQYSRNLKERLRSEDLPEGVRVDFTNRQIRFVIPKLHIHGHQTLCQLLFNLNYTWGVGRTDGEGVERPWGILGPLGASLRAMGPGSAADTLDDHIGFWNFCKLVALGLLLRRRMLAAVKELLRQKADFAEFTKAQSGHVSEWSAMVIQFEKDSSYTPNPFEMPKSGATENDVALELANEEEARARRGLEARNEMSPSQYLIASLAVEDDMRSLKYDVANGKYTTTQQLTELSKQRTKMRRTLTKLSAVQEVYVPSATSLRRAYLADVRNAEAPVESEPLYLPSELDAVQRALCTDGVLDIERRLRHAQCRTALDTIRHYLQVKKRMLVYKNTNVRAQGASTRARTIIDNNEHKIQLAARKYLNARVALVRLADGDESAVEWHSLNIHKDLRYMDEDERPEKRARDVDDDCAESEAAVGSAAGGHVQRCRDATGEGRRTMSWIWRGVDTSANGEGSPVYDGLRVEWCKAFARVRRWTEEVPLLQEEMRRTLTSLQWTAAKWSARAQDESRGGALGEGARAYADKQARTYRKLDAHFRGLWGGLIDVPSLSEKELQALQAAVAAEDAEEDGSPLLDDDLLAAEDDSEGEEEEEEEEREAMRRRRR